MYNHECCKQCTKSLMLANILFSLTDLHWHGCQPLASLLFHAVYDHILEMNDRAVIFDVFFSVSSVYLDNLWPRQLLSVVQID